MNTFSDSFRKKAYNIHIMHTFFLIFRLDTEVHRSGKTLPEGYYRFTYDLAGTEIPHPCEYSPDRWKWEECRDFASLGEFRDFFERLEPAPLRIETEDYVETVTHRGIPVPVFCDDYGQCFYCILDGKVVSFGSFQVEYEDEIRNLVDLTLDRKAIKL